MVSIFLCLLTKFFFTTPREVCLAEIMLCRSAVLTQICYRGNFIHHPIQTASSQPSSVLPCVWNKGKMRDNQDTSPIDLLLSKESNRAGSVLTWLGLRGSANPEACLCFKALSTIDQEHYCNVIIFFFSFWKKTWFLRAQLGQWKRVYYLKKSWNFTEVLKLNENITFLIILLKKKRGQILLLTIRQFIAQTYKWNLQLRK